MDSSALTAGGDGEWMRDWEERIKSHGGKLICDGVMSNEEPDDDVLRQCRDLGKSWPKPDSRLTAALTCTCMYAYRMYNIQKIRLQSHDQLRRYIQNPDDNGSYFTPQGQRRPRGDGKIGWKG